MNDQMKQRLEDRIKVTNTPELQVLLCDCRTLIEEQESKCKLYDEAQKALGGRLGVNASDVVWACEQYVAAEDALPGDEFDSEDYQLSKAVDCVVSRMGDADKLQQRIEELERQIAISAERFKEKEERLQAVEKALYEIAALKEGAGPAAGAWAIAMGALKQLHPAPQPKEATQ